MRRRLRKGGDSINSFMAWVGGKKALRDEILARFPRNYKRYIEVFGGAGWVLFHKPPGNDFEVFNDFNGNLVNLYRCVREQPEALRNELRYILGKRGRITIPYEIRKRVGFSYNDILSFAEQDDRTVIVRREKLCNDCRKAPGTPDKPEPEGITLLDFLDSLSAKEQRAALIHLSVRWAEQQGGEPNV